MKSLARCIKHLQNVTSPHMEMHGIAMKAEESLQEIHDRCEILHVMLDRIPMPTIEEIRLEITKIERCIE